MMTATRLRSPLSTITLASLTGLGLLKFAPAVGQLRAGLSRPYVWIEQVGPDAALASFAGALLWVAALWLAIALLAAMLARLPGRPGRMAGAFARRALPTALRSVVLASTGASLLIGPVTATAAEPTVSGQPAPTATTPFWPLDQPDRPLPAPGWPVSSGSAQVAAPTRATPDPSATVTAGPTIAPRSSMPLPTAGSTVTAATPPANSPIATEPGAPAPPPAHTPPASAGSVTVRPGDSLWTIAAHQLGTTAPASRIAVEWPYWYRANRKVIGNDPNLVQPGTELVVPDQAMDSAR